MFRVIARLAEWSFVAFEVEIGLTNLLQLGCFRWVLLFL